MAALKRMLPRDRGTIVQVGSALAYRGIPLQSAYCGAKHAIQGFTESVRSELFHDKSNIWITMVQMPALNTPQFGWVKSRLPHKAQPVPPIYQPEVAAEAIYWAAHNRRRELNVGANTSIFLWGNKLVPLFGDWYLSRTGYKSQQTQQPRDPNQPENLWEPVAGDHGAHGEFDEQAKDESLQLWATTEGRWFSIAGAGAAFAAALTLPKLLGRKKYARTTRALCGGLLSPLAARHRHTNRKPRQSLRTVRASVPSKLQANLLPRSAFSIEPSGASVNRPHAKFSTSQGILEGTVHV